MRILALNFSFLNLGQQFTNTYLPVLPYKAWQLLKGYCLFLWIYINYTKTNVLLVCFVNHNIIKSSLKLQKGYRSPFVEKPVKPANNRCFHKVLCDFSVISYFLNAVNESHFVHIFWVVRKLLKYIFEWTCLKTHLGPLISHNAFDIYI